MTQKYNFSCNFYTYRMTAWPLGSFVNINRNKILISKKYLLFLGSFFKKEIF